MSYVNRMTEIYREVIEVVHQLVPGTSTSTWDRIFAEAASKAPPELDMDQAVERATDALIEIVDPHHSYERSYWRPQAANILANAFMAEKRIIPADRIPELNAESDRLYHEILSLQKRRDGIEFSLFQSGEARLKHVHVWVETEIGCEDCGSHPALRCDSEDPECPVLVDLGLDEYIDLCRYDDPREEEGNGVQTS